jgi:2-phosphosulfolactate phosphatase
VPSPNGAALSFHTRHRAVLAACLRNARVVADAAARLGSTVAVIAAGETWSSGEFRPALEDLIGAGAVIANLHGARLPEAELAERGFGCDVDLAA